MSPNARHRALLAAARLVGGAALVAACPSPPTGPPPEPAGATAREGAVDLADCRAKVTAAVAAGGALDEATKACCQHIADDFDGHGLQGMEGWTERTACCSALDWQGSMACTPWGPPTPPSLVS